jgi:hypothetical protein
VLLLAGTWWSVPLLLSPLLLLLLLLLFGWVLRHTAALVLCVTPVTIAGVCATNLLLWLLWLSAVAGLLVGAQLQVTPQHHELLLTAGTGASTADNLLVRILLPACT